jgi:hypothetical protein
MDLENVPNIVISKKKERELQMLLKASFEDSKRSYEKWVVEMRKLGHSDEEIEKMLCY